MDEVESCLSKIERNLNGISETSFKMKDLCLMNIEWAKELTKRLGSLDLAERKRTINKINEVLDIDYVNMGFASEDSIKLR